MTALRRYLALRPRGVLLMLLAFAIEMLQPSNSPRWHTHAGGDHVHVHIAPVRDGAAPIAGVATGGDDTGSKHAGARRIAIARGGRSAHCHFPTPLHLASTSVLPTIRPALLASSAAVTRADAAVIAAIRAARSRAPPAVSA